MCRLFFCMSVFFAAISLPVFADDFGYHTYCMVRNLMTGNIGTLLGLSVAFCGFVMFIVNENKDYLLWVLAGIAFTALPGLYENFLKGMAHASGAVDTGNNNKKYLTLQGNACRGIQTSKGTGVVVDEDGKAVLSTEDN